MKPKVYIPLILIGLFVFASTDGFKDFSILSYLRKGSIENPVKLPPNEVTKITGNASIGKYGAFYVNLYNGTEWTVTGLDVILTNNNTNQNRRFRVSPPTTETIYDPSVKRVIDKEIEPTPTAPYSHGSLTTNTSDFLRDVKSGEWSWTIEEVFGFRK